MMDFAELSLEESFERASKTGKLCFFNWLPENARRVERLDDVSPGGLYLCEAPNANDFIAVRVCRDRSTSLRAEDSVGRGYSIGFKPPYGVCHSCVYVERRGARGLLFSLGE